MTAHTINKEKEEEIKSFVREHYSQAIQQSTSSCCTNNSKNLTHSAEARDAQMAPFLGYTSDELKGVPEDAVANSLGCGNPLAFAEVEPGQTVVDIGSGAGIDCFIAAERVGPSGKVIGVDMTPAMLERARVNAKKAGLSNVEFRQGDADALPLENNSVDWVISNCVINLAPDKTKAFREIGRVLKPGGRISVSDIVVGNLPWWIKRSKLFYGSCVSGALHEEDYLEAIRSSGLAEVKITSRFHFDGTTISGFCCSAGVELFVNTKRKKGVMEKLEGWILPKMLQRFSKPIGRRLAGQVSSIKVSARKPA